MTFLWSVTVMKSADCRAGGGGGGGGVVMVESSSARPLAAPSVGLNNYWTGISGMLVDYNNNDQLQNYSIGNKVSLV